MGDVLRPMDAIWIAARAFAIAIEDLTQFSRSNSAMDLLTI